MFSFILDAQDAITDDHWKLGFTNVNVLVAPERRAMLLAKRPSFNNISKTVTARILSTLYELSQDI